MAKYNRLPRIRMETSHDFDAYEDNRIFEIRYDPAGADDILYVNDEETVLNTPFLIMKYKIEIITNTNVAIWQAIGPHEVQDLATNWQTGNIDEDFNKFCKNVKLGAGSLNNPRKTTLRYEGKPIKVGTPYAPGDSVWFCMHNLTPNDDATYYARAYVEYKELN